VRIGRWSPGATRPLCTSAQRVHKVADEPPARLPQRQLSPAYRELVRGTRHSHHAGYLGFAAPRLIARLWSELRLKLAHPCHHGPGGTRSSQFYRHIAQLLRRCSCRIDGHWVGPGCATCDEGVYCCISRICLLAAPHAHVVCIIWGRFRRLSTAIPRPTMPVSHHRGHRRAPQGFHDDLGPRHRRDGEYGANGGRDRFAATDAGATSADQRPLVAVTGCDSHHFRQPTPRSPSSHMEARGRLVEAVAALLLDHVARLQLAPELEEAVGQLVHLDQVALGGVPASSASARRREIVNEDRSGLAR